MNNLPAALLARGVIAGAHGGEHAIYAALLGANIGPNIVPFGSLATMLVLGVARKKGQPISGLEVLKTGIWMTPLVLAGAMLALALSLSIWR
jgi:arsenical pump membrane protein